PPPPPPRPADKASPAATLRAQALSALRQGDYEAAFALLQGIVPLPESDRALYNSLRSVIMARRTAPVFAAAHAYTDRLEIAMKLSKLKLHLEALGILTEQVIVSAAKDEMAYNVASVFHDAGAASDFLTKMALRKAPEFYTAYAQAFDMLDCSETALALLRKKSELEDEDYPLYFSLNRKLGGLDRIEADVLPEGQKVRLAQALIEDQKEASALRVLHGISRERWTKREYAAALRVCQRLNRFEEAQSLFRDVQKRMSLSESADLHYYFAVFCEKEGQFDRAKGIYQNLHDLLGDFRDVRVRLNNLARLREDEVSRVSTILGGFEPDGAATGAAKPETGEAIAGRFQVKDILGVGGMGAVFRAKDLVLPREVALKRIKDEIAGNPRAKAAFIEEARTLATLQNPYIVALHDIVEDKGATYLVFEYVAGETVYQIITSRGKFEPGKCRRLLRFVCDALIHAHEKKIIHRDLKPDNIMVDPTGHLKVMDFGIAKQVETSAGLRDTGSVAGTLFYMSPEQHQGKSDYVSDIFGVGATAYEMLTGKLPFEEKDLYAQKMAERYGPLPGTVPQKLREVVVSCLKPDPADRPKSATELSKLLAGAA
ncbi:protein kinase, partial [Elusimicrobiota bacterium]